jgi:sugar diacid utilization regulator
MVVVACESVDLDAALRVVERSLGALKRPSAVAIRAPLIVGVTEASTPLDLASLGRLLHEALGPDSRVGVGGVAADAQALRASVVGAEHACRYARRHGTAGFATHDALASLGLLLAVQDSSLLTAFEHALLRPLQEHDARRGTELVETLDRFLTSGGEFQTTAHALNIHVNTLRLRLARVESLTGRRLSSMEDRVDFWIALRARGAGGPG